MGAAGVVGVKGAVGATGAAGAMGEEGAMEAVGGTVRNMTCEYKIILYHLLIVFSSNIVTPLFDDKGTDHF